MKEKILYVLVIFFMVVALLLTIGRAKAMAPTMELNIPADIVNDEIKTFAYTQVAFAFGEEHWESFNNIVQRESEWNPNNQNPKSTAYGIGQFLNSTWQDTGFKKTSDPKIQISAMIVYISKRYEDPMKAWRFWQVQKWY